MHSIIPGTYPATHILPTDTPVIIPYRIRGTPGGMIGVMREDAAVTAVLNALG